jgi:integrase
MIKLYGDNTHADDFKTSCLRCLREEMIQSGRFCRNQVNDYTRRIISLFTWAGEMEYVKPETWTALKAVKHLPKGYPGTFENPEREEVSDAVIIRTLPFLPPTLVAMIKLQRLTGCRPSEIFNMRVGQIDRGTDPEFWIYRIPSHKTEEKVKWKKVIPLGKHEQALLAPYLENKEAGAAVFSPAQAMEERKAERRAKRQSKMTPSQMEREQRNALKPSRYQEFYNKDSYRTAVLRGIEKANRQFTEEEKIPVWTPYQIRHRAGTAMELEVGLDEAQALLDHTSANTTKRYAHGRLEKQKKLARNRRNPFEVEKPNKSDIPLPEITQNYSRNSRPLLLTNKHEGVK